MTLAEIKTEVDRLAAMIGAAGYVLPTYGQTEDFARPHIEVDSRGFHYVVIERGQELSHLILNTLDELLFVRSFESGERPICVVVTRIDDGERWWVVTAYRTDVEVGTGDVVWSDDEA